MPDLLLELFSEEIPAGMQARGAQDLQRLVTEGLTAAGLDFTAAKSFAGPRRLTLVVEGLPDKSPDISEERKGPRVGSPDKAVEGFLRGAGLNSIGEAEIVSDAKKGDFYVARISKPGRATSDVIAELMPGVIRQFPWPKSQRWGAGRLRWVRPLHAILCLLGGRTVPFAVDGITSGDTTFGHRFMAPKAIRVSDFAGYAQALREAFVMLDASEREATILQQARAAARAQGLELVEDPGLLAETAGLVEWPVALMGCFDDAFLDLPPEVIVTTIRKHQKCFSLRDAGSGRLASRFILVANIEAEDGGKAIVAGNERVVRARLADAQFFWDQDRKVKLEDRLPELKDIIFHEKLGTQAQRVERLKTLARALAPVVGADSDKAERAAQLCKADLVTGMVGEFPDLQGVMGKYYALAQGEDASVAAAIEQHYKPAGQSDAVPGDPVSVAVALADKLDTLVGFWAIDEKPTSSKDPYALRRAALGVIRIVLENEFRIDLLLLMLSSTLNVLRIYDYKYVSARRYELEMTGGPEASQFPEFLREVDIFSKSSPWRAIIIDSTNLFSLKAALRNPDFNLNYQNSTLSKFVKDVQNVFGIMESYRVIEAEEILKDDDLHEEDEATYIDGYNEAVNYLKLYAKIWNSNLLAFFHDRLKVYLRDRGARHDLIDAVIAPDADDLLMIVARVEALGRFLETDDGANLLAGVKRAANILRIEEKKDGRAFDGAPDLALFRQDEEKALAAAIDAASAEAAAAVGREDFEGAMSAIARLRAPVDAFFDHVTVNADDPKLRENRLKLLNRIRQSTLSVADFSKISG